MEILYKIILNDYDNSSGLKIALHFEKKTPVACVIFDVPEHFVSVFVTPEFRGKGIGKRLVNRILKRYNKTPDKVVAGEGDDNSMAFFKSIGIFCVEYNDTLLEEPLTEEETRLLLKKTIAQIMQMRRDKEEEELKQLASLDKPSTLEATNSNVIDVPRDLLLKFEDL